MKRIYECTSSYCPNRGQRVTIKGRPNGPLWEFPTVVCECGCEPLIVGPAVIDSGDAFIEKYHTPELLK